MLTRLQSLLGDTSGSTLALTGVLGLAAVVYALYHLRGGAGQKPDEPSPQQQQEQQPQQQQPNDPNKPSSSAAAAAAGQPAAITPSPAVARRLAGVRRVTMSVPGVLLEETSPEQFQESASVLPQAVGLAREIASWCTANMYLMCQVADDLGEALVRGALEHAGMLGKARGQVPPHRLLFCETLEGKNSFVRQLEPDLHIDGHPKNVADLQRFVKQLILVQPAGQQLAGSSDTAKTLAEAANVQQAPSLAAALGVAEA